MRQIALLFLITWIAIAQNSTKEELSTLEGRVVNSATGDPVVKASIRLTPTGTPSLDEWVDSYAVSSNSAGAFAIGHIRPGKYQLQVSRTGFLAVERGSSQRSGRVLDFRVPQNLKGIEIRLMPQGVIAGRVFDVDGEPLERVQVQLLRSKYVNGKKIPATIATSSTNDLGEYRFSLMPGKYYVYADVVDSRLPPGAEAGEDYVPVYYPGSIDVAGAIALDIEPGAQVQSVDLIMRKARTVAARGRVIVDVQGATGLPTVHFAPQMGHDNYRATSFRTFEAKVAATGEFEIRTLTAGPYVASAVIGVGGIGVTSGRLNLEIAEVDVDDIVLRIAGGFSIAGHVRIEGEKKQNLQNASVRFRPGGPGADFSHGGSTPISKDGTFQDDNNFPGIYGVLVGGLPDGFYTQSIRVADKEVMYSGIDLTSGPSGPLEIVVSPKAALVTGIVQDEKTGTAVDSATVVMVPQEKERLGISAFYPQAGSDQSGRFTFKSVPPGEYRIYAWEDVEPTAWMDPDFIRPIKDKG